MERQSPLTTQEEKSLTARNRAVRGRLIRANAEGNTARDAIKDNDCKHGSLLSRAESAPDCNK